MDNYTRNDIEFLILKEISSHDVSHFFEIFHRDYQKIDSHSFACGALRFLANHNTKHKVARLRLRAISTARELQEIVVGVINARIANGEPCGALSTGGKSITQKTLAEKARKFKKFGYNVLIHRGTGNANAQKITDTDKRVLVGLKKRQTMKQTEAIYFIMAVSGNQYIDRDTKKPIEKVNYLSKSTIRRFLLSPEKYEINPIYVDLNRF